MYGRSNSKEIEGTSTGVVMGLVVIGMFVFGASGFALYDYYKPSSVEAQAAFSQPDPIVEVQEDGVNWCDPKVLAPYFGPQADIFACIVEKESSCNPRADNSADVDFESSWGLLQKNGKDGVSEEKFKNSGGRVANKLKNMLGQFGASSCADGLKNSNNKLIQACKRFYFDPENNLEWASWLYRTAGYNPWFNAARMCGVIR
jgi:hypothetical protein